MQLAVSDSALSTSRLLTIIRGSYNEVLAVSRKLSAVGLMVLDKKRPQSILLYRVRPESAKRKTGVSSMKKLCAGLAVVLVSLVAISIARMASR